MATSDTNICNQSLGRIGVGRIDDLATGSSVEAIQCRIHYYAVRDSLQRKYRWRFNRGRTSIASDATAPAFEFTYRYQLPNDFLGLRWVQDDYGTLWGKSDFRHAIEGQYILSDYSSPLKIIYSKRIENVGLFDPVYEELLVLTLAKRLIGPLGENAKASQLFDNELLALTRQAAAIDGAEQETGGREAAATWLDARYHKSASAVTRNLGSIS